MILSIGGKGRARSVLPGFYLLNPRSRLCVPTEKFVCPVTARAKRM